MDKSTSICIIAPSRKLVGTASNVVNRLGEKIDIHYVTLDHTEKRVKDLKKTGAEVFISRAGSLEMIRRTTNVTTVEIRSSLSDYTGVLETAKNMTGMVAFFFYGKVSADLFAICNVMDIQAKWYEFKDEPDGREKVLQAVREGAALGVGGAYTEGVAREVGLPYLTLESSEESVYLAIQEAVNILSVQRTEKAKQAEMELRLNRYQMVMDYTHDAILSINTDGYIDVVNRAAEKYLNMNSKQLIGNHIRNVMPKSEILQTLKNGKAVTDQLLNYGNITLDSNYAPIFAEGKIRGAVATFQDIRSIQTQEQRIRLDLHAKGLTAKYTFSDIVGNSAAIVSAIRTAESYAATDSTVLIHGETGTGKELFAQSIHNSGKRKNAPFVAINCATLDKNLLESELFGYVEGAFTGAKKGGKTGLFELAHTGTIFLDEIGEIPMELQAKLLRVLQEKEIHRIGGDKVIPVNVRIIAATNRDLRSEIIEGRFREDLFYRLDVLNLEIPPLRERGEDVALIADSFAKEFLTSEDMVYEDLYRALERLRDYSWPGNIRELRNTVERITVIMKYSAAPQALDQLLDQILRNQEDAGTEPFAGLSKKDSVYSRKEEEYNAILRILRKNHGKIGKTAEELGMGRTTLWRKLKEYGIQID